MNKIISITFIIIGIIFCLGGTVIGKISVKTWDVSWMWAIVLAVLAVIVLGYRVGVAAINKAATKNKFRGRVETVHFVASTFAVGSSSVAWFGLLAASRFLVESLSKNEYNEYLVCLFVLILACIIAYALTFALIGAEAWTLISGGIFASTIFALGSNKSMLHFYYLTVSKTTGFGKIFTMAEETWLVALAVVMIWVGGLMIGTGYSCFLNKAQTE